ncbi:adenylate kinase family enzyme [Haloferula luteola]|uniref:Adenylate kinase family enzyme n=1 Tax=Haloferula luteola TaxID=595692 RepID=A0A840VF80_9BACT|nr:topology modulation protein [Haloferula luteola]MBB5351461.1 adenylate kinase family enzyme [Haloferula luteola]
MQRVLVTGNAGAGKSTVAKAVSAILGFPIHHMDMAVWLPGWKKVPQDLRDRRVDEWTGEEAWVIDGVSSRVLSRADTVVFLDVPRRLSFWRVFWRNLPHLFKSRPELPPGCPEILIIPTLCRIIWQFPVRIRPGLMESMKEPMGKQQWIYLRTREEVAEFLSELEFGSGEEANKWRIQQQPERASKVG